MKIGTGQGQRTKRPRNQLKLLADNSEPIVIVPAVPEPVEVHAAPAVIAAKIRDVAVVVPVLPDRTKSDNGKLPLLFRVGGSEDEKFVDGGRAKTLLFELLDGFVRADGSIEGNQLQLDLCLGGLS